MKARTRAWVASAAYKTAITLLTDARKGAGMTQRDLARAVGKVPSWVAKIEQLERRVDIIEFVAIARAVGQDEQKLFRAFLGRLPKKIEI